MTKRCHRCGEIKPLSEFGVQMSKKDGRRGTCKSCMKLMDASYRASRREVRAAESKRWREENPEKARRSTMNWRAKNADRARELLQMWHRANPNKQSEYAAARSMDPGYRLSTAIRAGISSSIRGERKGGRRTEDLLGYTITELRSHLESLFVPGMTWDNYGQYGWHIDHVRPLSSFVITSAEDESFKQAWALSNLQPLWWRDNISKGSKWTPANDNEPLAAISAA